MCKSQRLFRSVIAIAWATVVAVPALAAAQDQVNAADRAKAEAEARAQAIERNTRENARQLTLYDKQGKVVATVGDRAPIASKNKRQPANASD